MQTELLTSALLELQAIKEDTMRKIIYTVEWHYECTGEPLPIELVFAKVDLEIEKDFFIYAVTDVFFEEALKTYEDIVGDLDSYEE